MAWCPWQSNVLATISTNMLITLWNTSSGEKDLTGRLEVGPNSSTLPGNSIPHSIRFNRYRKELIIGFSHLQIPLISLKYPSMVQTRVVPISLRNDSQGSVLGSAVSCAEHQTFAFVSSDLKLYLRNIFAPAKAKKTD